MKLFKNINISKLKEGLSKTRDKIVSRIQETFSGKAKLPEEILNELEEILITSDIGYDTTEFILDELRKSMKQNERREPEDIITSLKEILTSILTYSSENEIPDKIDSNKPFVLLIVGVNGSGKTTTIGKLAYNFKQAGLSVIVGAADTFRAAANEQLDIWANRAGVEILDKGLGADPSSVAFEAVQIAINKKFDVAIIDTAGRLHTKTNLMEELSKIKRAISKLIPNAPHETFLVLDGTTGQNAVTQIEEFSKVANISGIVITKLDGTAKGGVLFQISSKYKIPIKYIGVGEGIDDLQIFSPKNFVDALFSTNEKLDIN